MLKRIDEIGREYGLRITNVFHAGDGNVHPIFLYDDRDESEVQNTLRAAQKVLQFCVDVGGTITGEHGVGVEKIHLMPYLFDETTMNAFSRVKLVFDPNEQINAGKLIPSEKVKRATAETGEEGSAMNVTRARAATRFPFDFAYCPTVRKTFHERFSQWPADEPSISAGDVGVKSPGLGIIASEISSNFIECSVKFRVR